MKTTAFGHLGWERPFKGYLCTVERCGTHGLTLAAEEGTTKHFLDLEDLVVIIETEVGAEGSPIVKVLSKYGVGLVNQRWLFVVSRGQ